jgi:hypothetical protein
MRAWALLLVCLAGCGAAADSPPPVVPTGRAPAARYASFISLWPACACARTTVLAQFSLRDGRRLGAVAKVRSGPGITVGNPRADRRGNVWITVSSGPRCTSNANGCGPVPDSCSGTVTRFEPTARRAVGVLAFPPSILVVGAVPSPDGHRVALRTGGCTAYFDDHLLVRDLRSGRRWTIGADAARCHDLRDPSWSPDGRRLVFPYGAARGRSGAGCQMPPTNRLVGVSALRPSTAASWRPIDADRGCSFQAATFDRRGIAAIEACRRRAYLVQLDHRRVALRRALAPGYNEGDIAFDRRTGDVLVSRTVKDLTVGSDIDFEDRGAHQLKGVPGDWELFAVSAD